MADLIQILPATQIDKEKWDRCINESSNGLIYSYTDYLHAMSENWHGLVIDDYKVVMPLPWKRKFGIRYGYTPPFIQQLGLIGMIDDINLQPILSSIHHFYLFADINFNFSNAAIQNSIPATQRTNLIIDLSQGYSLIQSQYKSDLKENIKKAGMLTYTEDTIEQSVSLYQTQYSERMPHITGNDYKNFYGLCLSLQKKKQCITRTITDENNHVLSTAVLLKDNKRMYNLMNTTTQEGRNKESNPFLLDQIIREFAGQSLLFDFEGSELPGVQAFYEKFGAVNQPYFYYHYNGLPWPLSLFRH